MPELWTDDTAQCGICSEDVMNPAQYPCFLEVNCTLAVAFAMQGINSGSSDTDGDVIENEVISACGGNAAALFPIDPWASRCCHFGSPATGSVYCVVT
jgi:hypothetical protein